jgi:outer membrane PBP1 activator LpoA protein
VRSAWPTRTTRLDRLYAFGFDAYRLVPELRANALSESNTFAGVTGRLRLDQHNKIRRDLDWAQIRNGAPTEVPAQL